MNKNQHRELETKPEFAASADSTGGLAGAAQSQIGVEAILDLTHQTLNSHTQNRLVLCETPSGDSDPNSTPFGVRHFWYKI